MDDWHIPHHPSSLENSRPHAEFFLLMNAYFGAHTICERIPDGHFMRGSSSKRGESPLKFKQRYVIACCAKLVGSYVLRVGSPMVIGSCL